MHNFSAISQPSCIEEVATPELSLLVELLSALRHDLGKYITMNLRWIPRESSTEALREALYNDLAATRRKGEVVEDAWSVWQQHAPWIIGCIPLPNGQRVDLSRDPDVARVLSCMDRIHALIPLLGVADRTHLEAGAADAREVADVLSRLLARARSAVQRRESTQSSSHSHG